MTQKDKELLFKDLCARLPYVLYCNITDYTAEREEDENFDAPLLSIERTESGGYATFRFAASEYKIWNNRTQLVKPYLRPLSSMTKEERYEIQEILGKDIEILDGFINIIESSRKRFSFLELHALFNWLNVHHFDFRNLIGEGFALEAPEGMYNLKEK